MFFFYTAFLCDIITFEIMKETENCRHVAIQRDRSFYGNLHKMIDILIMLLICVESEKVPKTAI